jgi:F0F1-type ATP synthase epsilon subunit
VNIPAESGEMGILANHVPAIEQLKPGLVEIIEEAGASKQFFRTSHPFIGELEVESKDLRTVLRTWD